ncbi:hypothetical protein FHS90_002624 [Rufibacter quisquiliarum]|uniref:Uncharacterized protein n=1 Tax=Rufibacter quisquiliarum TaxID=1549639 RepID=A0A839GQW9_9BACT|nr:hypothetical protein [Rufibacter quisquiliarum]
MKVQQQSLPTSLGSQYQPAMSYNIISHPGGQTTFCTPQQVEDSSLAWSTTYVDFMPSEFVGGFKTESFFISTYDFESLTGHPGIRY